MTPKAAADTVLGKKVSDLQNGITVSGYAIAGNLNYVTGYTEFSKDAAKQTGNYLALQFTADPWPDAMTVQLTGTTDGVTALVDGANWKVFRITDKANQKVRVFTENAGITQTRDYDLSKLVLATQAKTDEGIVDRDVTA